MRLIFQNIPLIIENKIGILNVAIIKYSLHKFRETKIRRKYQLTEAIKQNHLWKSVTRVHDNAERWSIYQIVQYFIWSTNGQNVQYFIRSKNRVLNFTAVRCSLHKCSETTLY